MNPKSIHKMFRFCEEELSCSFYELKDYASENNSEWHEYLKVRKNCIHVSTYLKSRKRVLKKEGKKFPTLADSIDRILDSNNQ